MSAAVSAVRSDGMIELAETRAGAGTRFYEIKLGGDLLGFAKAEGQAASLIAGRAAVGSEAIPIERPAARVGLVAGPEHQRVQEELAVLCPSRVERRSADDVLDAAAFDALVVTAPIDEAKLWKFVAAGRVAIVDLAVYAAWDGAACREVESERAIVVQAKAESPAMRGLAVGQTFQHYGRRDKLYVCRCLDQPREAGRVLIALAASGEPVAVEHGIGTGRLVALDLLSPNGEPGYGYGAVLKWLLPGNLLCRSVRHCSAVSTRLKFEPYMKLQEAVAERVRGAWVRERVGTDSGGRPIWSFRMGPRDRPTFLFTGAVHAGEWVNPYLLLDFIKYMARPAPDDYKARWVQRRFSILAIPMLSGSLRQESSAGCDLNRNFDFRWEDYTKGYGWRKGRALKLRGTAPFSEPEARVVRDIVWNQPIIGYLDTHMHGLKHGAMFFAAHRDARTDMRAFDAAAAVLSARMADRFLWRGPKPFALRRVANYGGPGKPFAINWAAHQGLWATSTELAGGADHSLQNKEGGIEALLAFMEAVGVEYGAGKRAWLGLPRTGFARPGGCKDAAAMVFTREGKQVIAFRTNRGHGTLRVPLPPAGCRLADAAGSAVEWRTEQGGCAVPMGKERLFLECGAASRDEVLAALKGATFEPQ